MSNLNSHVIAATNSAPFSDAPFPHLFVENFLPQEFYEKLASSWPDFSEIANGPDDTIARVDFAEDGFNKAVSIGDENLRNWADFRTVVKDTFFPAALERFRPYLTKAGDELLMPDPSPLSGLIHKIGKTLNFAPSSILGGESSLAEHFDVDSEFLVIRRDLSVLGAHVDPPQFHFTLLVLFAPDRSKPHLGTDIYRQTGPGRAKLPSETEDPGLAQFAETLGVPHELDTTLPFVPNAVLLFLNGLHSWHGQRLTEVIDRKTYHIFFKTRDDLRSKVFRPEDTLALAR